MWKYVLTKKLTVKKEEMGDVKCKRDEKNEIKIKWKIREISKT